MNNTNAHITLLNNTDFASDTSFIRKQVSKGGQFFSELITQLSTIEQLQNITKNQKGVKRYTQAINFALNGDVTSFDAVTAYTVSCIALTKSKSISFQDVHFLCGVGSDNASHIKGISRAKVSRFIGSAGTTGTVTSKVSRTVGKNGFFTALNITEKSDKHSFTLTDTAKNNALILAYAYQLERMTDSTFLTLSTKNK